LLDYTPSRDADSWENRFLIKEICRMYKRLFLLVAVLLSLTLSNGCFTLMDDDWSFNPFNDHNAKIVNKMFDDLNESHRDFDAIVFGIYEDDE
jgi:hypothetical protein